MSDVPEGFEALDTASPFNTLVGPYHTRMQEGRLILGLRLEGKHCNSAGGMHGSMMCAMADIAIGHNVGLSLAGDNTERETIRGAPRAPIATVSLNTDFLGTARQGDWVEVHVQVLKTGRTLSFANAEVRAGDALIARANATFRILRPASSQ